MQDQISMRQSVTGLSSTYLKIEIKILDSVSTIYCGTWCNFDCSFMFCHYHCQSVTVENHQSK